MAIHAWCIPNGCNCGLAQAVMGDWYDDWEVGAADRVVEVADATAVD